MRVRCGRRGGDQLGPRRQGSGQASFRDSPRREPNCGDREEQGKPVVVRVQGLSRDPMGVGLQLCGCRRLCLGDRPALLINRKDAGQQRQRSHRC